MRSAIFTVLFSLLVVSAGVVSGQNRDDLNFPPLIYDDFGNPVRLGDGRCIAISEGFHQGIFPGMDDIIMAQIGTLVAPMYNAMAGGDSDDDGLFEAYMYIKDNVGGWTYTYRIYENDGMNNYTQVFHGTEGMIPYAYGDLDGDGLPEVIGQWSYWVYVYESPAQGQ